MSIELVLSSLMSSTSYGYRNLPIKCPWALEIHGPKNGVGVYKEKPFVRITHIHMDHTIIKKQGWALTRKWALTRENTVTAFTQQSLLCTHYCM